MKKSIQIICTILLIGFSSCKKTINYHPEWDVPLPESVSAKVDGNAFESTATSAVLYTSAGNLLQIVGERSGVVFNLSLSAYHGVGDYVVSTTGAYLTYSENTSSLASSWVAQSGTVKITTVNENRVTGTFSFIGTDIAGNGTSKTISEGKFSVTYTSL